VKTNRRVPQGYTGFAEPSGVKAYRATKDYTDYTRTNPDLEATRERWNMLHDNSLVPPPAPRITFNPVWPVTWLIVIVGLCFIAAVG